jgi:probable blue pigment (indigoidine) exporter
MMRVHHCDEKHVLDSFVWRADDGRVTTTIGLSEASAPVARNSTGALIGWTALTAVAPAVWGTTYIVTTHMLPEGHAMFSALMRSLPAGLIAVLLSRRLPRGTWWWKSLVLGTLNMGVFLPLLFVAAQRLPGGVAAILGSLQPVVVAFLAVSILHERLSTWRVSWALVGVFGVSLVVLGPDAALDPIGILAGLGGAASMGTGVVLTKKWGRPQGVTALGLAGWQLTAAGLVLLIPALLIDGIPPRIDGFAVAGYLWLGLIGALLTYTLWFSGIRRLPVTATALLGLLSPLVATILGAAIAGEAITPIRLIGFAAALTAMVAGQLTRQRKRARPTMGLDQYRVSQDHPHAL